MAALGMVAPPLGLAAFFSVVELTTEGAVDVTLGFATDSLGLRLLLLATQPGGLCAAFVMYGMLKSAPAPEP